MSKNNPQYEDAIEGKSGEIVVDICGFTIQIRCIDELNATSVCLYPHQIPNLINQLEDALEKQRRMVYMG